MADENKQEDNSNKTSNSKFIYMMVGISFAVFALLFLWTDVFYDATITFQPFLIAFTILFIFAPLLLIFFPVEKFSKYIAIGCCVMTVLLCIILFWRRNKITKIYVPDDFSIQNGQEELMKKLNDKITPSGVVIVLGKNASTIFTNTKGNKAFAIYEKMKEYKSEKTAEELMKDEKEGAGKDEEKKGEDEAENKGEAEAEKKDEAEGEKKDEAEGEKKDEEDKKEKTETFSNEDAKDLLKMFAANSEGDNKNAKSLSELKGVKLFSMKLSRILKPKQILPLTFNDFSANEKYDDDKYRKKQGILDISEFDKKKDEKAEDDKDKKPEEKTE